MGMRFSGHPATVILSTSGVGEAIIPPKNSLLSTRVGKSLANLVAWICLCNLKAHDLPIVFIVVPFFVLTSFILRILKVTPKRNCNGDYGY